MPRVKIDEREVFPYFSVSKHPCSGGYQCDISQVLLDEYNASVKEADRVQAMLEIEYMKAAEDWRDANCEVVETNIKSGPDGRSEEVGA